MAYFVIDAASQVIRALVEHSPSVPTDVPSGVSVEIATDAEVAEFSRLSGEVMDGDLESVKFEAGATPRVVGFESRPVVSFRDTIVRLFGGERRVQLEVRNVDGSEFEGSEIILRFSSPLREVWVPLQKGAGNFIVRATKPLRGSFRSCPAYRVESPLHVAVEVNFLEG
jgi:hypothetical protein